MSILALFYIDCLPCLIVGPLFCREYWMIYGGPGFLAVVWFGSTPPSPLSNLDRKTEKERQLAEERGWEVGEGAKSYNGENAWSSIYHSIIHTLCLQSKVLMTSLGFRSLYQRTQSRRLYLLSIQIRAFCATLWLGWMPAGDGGEGEERREGSQPVGGSDLGGQTSLRLRLPSRHRYSLL